VQPAGEPVGGPGGVGAHHDGLVTGSRGQLRQGEVDHVDVVGDGVGAGVAGPQDAGQRLAGAVAAVQAAHQRVEPEAALVGPGRALLVGVRGHQGGVHVHQQQPIHVGAGLPRPCPGLRPGGPQPGQAVFVAGDSLDHPPGGRGGRYLAEQRRLVAQHRKIRKAVPAVGQHHHKVAQHASGPMPMPPGLPATRPPAKRLGEPQPVGQLDQQQRAGVADDAVPVGSDVNPRDCLGTLHQQGALLEPGLQPSDSRILPAQEGTCMPAHAPPSPLMNSPG
jgi:hypothetical protein